MTGRTLVAIALLTSAACRGRTAPDPGVTPASGTSETVGRVARHYADIAAATYEDAAAGARALRAAIDALVAAPTADRMATARQAWLAARTPYVQTEAFRFYDGPIDRVEMLINAWPIDESYVDYITGAPEAGIVNDAKGTPELSGPALIALNEREGEKSISTGFHAIEFLLWGQDRRADGPGARAATDYAPPAPSARRRGQYLRAAAALLERHLTDVAAEWSPAAATSDGGITYRARFLAMPAMDAVRLIVKGLGSLSGPELTGERLTVAYETKDQENEHSCFSDNTHNDVVGDVQGIDNVCRGRYLRTDGRVVEGPGLLALLAERDTALARALAGAVDASLAAARRIPAPFDQAIVGRDDAPGRRAIKEAIAALDGQTEILGRVAAKLGLRLSSTVAAGR